MKIAHAGFLIFALAQPAFASNARNDLPYEAGPVSFGETQKDAKEREIIIKLDPASAAVGVKIESALVDLDGDKNAEIVARLHGKGDCDTDGSRCRTIVARYDAQNGWRVVLDRKIFTLAMAKPGFGGMRDLTIDGRETWSWNSSSYVLDVAASGVSVEFKEAPGSTRAALLAQFGPSAVKLGQKKPVKVQVAAVALSGATANIVMARLEGPGVCGMVMGCPTRLLQIKDGAYVTLMNGLTSGKVSVSPVERAGWRDIAAETPKAPGRVFYGWSGKNYSLAERIKGDASR